MEKCFSFTGDGFSRYSSSQTLQPIRNDNILPYFKIGGKVIYDEAEIEVWLNSNYHPKY